MTSAILEEHSALTATPPTHRRRFTLDGDESLESSLAHLCDETLAGVRACVPPDKLEALFLGGGYGRGEGGVLKTTDGDQPYNDLEFYVCLRGNRFLNRKLYGGRFEKLATTLSEEAGIEVEFHITSLTELAEGEANMFHFDLAAGHRVIFESAPYSKALARAWLARDLPLSEATRLLLNRGSGLLLAQRKLRQIVITSDAHDFIVRNIAKAQLAMGDALLCANGLYHWSCQERHQRLEDLPSGCGPLELEAIRRHHAAGVEFKLHPHQSVATPAELRVRHRQVLNLFSTVWLWVESIRLGSQFDSVTDYLSAAPPAREGASLKDELLSVRLFGPAMLLKRRNRLPPRERALRALAVLLWCPDEAGEFLPKLLGVDSPPSPSDWGPEYERLWRRVR